MPSLRESVSDDTHQERLPLSIAVVRELFASILTVIGERDFVHWGRHLNIGHEVAPQ